jgi:hypothetical protein
VHDVVPAVDLEDGQLVALDIAAGVEASAAEDESQDASSDQADHNQQTERLRDRPGRPLPPANPEGTLDQIP